MAPTFTPPGPRSSSAIVALYVKVGACLLAIGADVGRMVTAAGLERGSQQIDDLLGADRLVLLGALLELVALAVALVFFLRWLAVVRGNRAVLGGTSRRGPLHVVWWVVLAAATIAVLLSWTVLGEAEDVADRQRIDALRAAATALSAVAAGVTIAVIATVTRRQEERAADVDAPRADVGAEPADESVSASGLRVVSEEHARRSGQSH